MNDFTVSVVGEDRPGIVAAVTGALLDLDGNVENCRASILAGSFALVLADGATTADIESALAPTLDALGLSAGVRPCTGSHVTMSGERGVITIYGADRPGIVHGAAQALADHGVNVVDLSSRLVGDPPIYVLGIEVELPVDMTMTALENCLRCDALRGLDISVQSEDDGLL
jgi:glycine cleavage system transcriptional repressor